jgi:WD40 repeat protein
MLDKLWLLRRQDVEPIWLENRNKFLFFRMIVLVWLLFSFTFQNDSSNIRHQIGAAVPVALAWRPSGDMLAVASQDEVWLYTTDGEPIMQLAIEAGLHPTYLAWHPNSNKFAASTYSNTETKAYIWSISGNPAELTVSLDEVIDEITIGLGELSWSPDTRLAIAETSALIQIWDTTIADFQHTIDPDVDAGVDAIAWSPDGSYLAATMSDYNVRIWDMSTYQLVATLENRVPSTVAWSPSGDQLAVASEYNIVVWEPAEGARSSPKFPVKRAA